MRRLVNRTLVWTLVSLGWLLVLACGQNGASSGSGAASGESKPSVAEARQKFEELYQGPLHQRICKVIAIRKLNGTDGEAFGVKTYRLDYEAEVEFMRDFQPALNDVAGLMLGEGKVGQRRTLTHHHVFEKTENGWK